MDAHQGFDRLDHALGVADQIAVDLLGRQVVGVMPQGFGLPGDSINFSVGFEFDYVVDASVPAVPEPAGCARPARRRRRRPSLWCWQRIADTADPGSR